MNAGSIAVFYALLIFLCKTCQCRLTVSVPDMIAQFVCAIEETKLRAFQLVCHLPYCVRRSNIVVGSDVELSVRFQLVLNYCPKVASKFILKTLSGMA